MSVSWLDPADEHGAEEHGADPEPSGWDAEPGYELLSWCFQARGRIDSLDNGERVDALVGYARFTAFGEAGKAAMIAALYDDVAREHAVRAAEDRAVGLRPTAAQVATDVDGEVSTEVALALGVTRRRADQEICFALALAQHPALGAALSRGQLDRPRAEAILDEVSNLPEATDRARVIARLVGGPDVALVRELGRPDASLWQLTLGRLRAIAAREVQAIDARAAARRAVAARAGRRVWQLDRPHAMGDLTIHAGAELTKGCWTSLDLAARAAKAAGDDRSLDALRTDIAVGRLSLGAFGTSGPEGVASQPGPAPERPQPGPTPTRPEILVNLTLPARTYVGLDDQPAILHGPGGPIPLPAELARALADRPDGVFLRRVLTDPATGIAWDVSRRYRPPAAMAAFVAARDGYRSRLPISGATRLEIDHVRRFAPGGVSGSPPRESPGGPTTAANLQSLGHRDHQPKTRGRLNITGNANAALTITTRAGKRYLSYPEPYHDPEPPWPP